MTIDQLIEIIIAATQSVYATESTIREWQAARLAFWNGLALETQQWLFTHGRTPPAHIEPITKTLISIGPQEAAVVIPQLTEADMLLTLAAAILDYIHPPGDWTHEELASTWAGPVTGLISPATQDPETGRFQASL